MMQDIKDIRKLITSGESATLEFKQNFNDEAIETIVAFANSSGGSVLIGVSNNMKITGTTTGNETLQNWANEIKNKTSPAQVVDITDHEIDGKVICQIRVNEYPVKPVSFKGRYFKRVKNSNHQLNVREISEIHLQSLQLSWDAYPYPKATMDDLDYHKIRQFITKVNNSGRFILPENVEDALNKLRMVVDNVPVNAAMLLFAKEHLNHNVHVGRFKTPSMIIDDKIYKGGLFEVVEETMRYIIGQIKVAFEITGKTTQRTEIFEYPIPALRELVLNAVIHRDYTSPVDIQIKIFDQSITFFNPGRLYGGLTIEQLKTDSYQSQTRNKLIAEAFYLTKDIEKYGSGFIRIRKEIKEYPSMEFAYSELGSGFLVEIKYEKQKLSTKTEPDVVDGVVEDVVEDVVDRRLKKVLELIKGNKDISASQIATALNISSRTVQRDIDRLKKQKRIIRVGPEKGGHWEIIQ
jgi:ATP-dependent DNA helicase RecG